MAKQTNKFSWSGPNTSGPTYVFNIFRHKLADERLLNAKVAPAGYRFFYGIEDAVLLFERARPQVSNHNDDFCPINAWVMISIRCESDSPKVIQETGIIERLCRAGEWSRCFSGHRQVNNEQLDDLKRESGHVEIPLSIVMRWLAQNLRRKRTLPYYYYLLLCVTSTKITIQINSVTGLGFLCFPKFSNRFLCIFGRWNEWISSRTTGFSQSKGLYFILRLKFWVT